MKKGLIKKKVKDFKIKPNLKDYQKEYRTFTWEKGEKELEWFPGGKINAAYNAVDRNATGFRKNKVALYWEGENGEKKKFTFQELAILSNQFANFLKDKEVERGDRVFFFLPRVPELYYGFLGTLKRSNH